MGKTTPLNDADMAEFVALQARFADSPKSWTVEATAVDRVNFDLGVKNPNKVEAVALRDPRDILAEIAALDAESAAILEEIGALL
jgi:type I restriction enzyme M protein